MSESSSTPVRQRSTRLVDLTAAIGTERLVLAVLGIAAFAVMVWYHPGQLYIDTRPDLYLDPGGLLRECLQTWVPGTGLGTTNYDTGYLPTAFVMWLLHLVHV